MKTIDIAEFKPQPFPSKRMETLENISALIAIEARARHIVLSDYSAIEEVQTAIEILGYDPREEK